MRNISNRTVYNSQVVWIGEDLNLKITFNKDFLNYYLIRNLKKVGTQAMEEKSPVQTREDKKKEQRVSD